MGKNFDPADACPVTTDAVLRRAAAVGPDLEAVVSPSGRRTYATLAAEVDRVRSALAAAGVRRGDHIAVCPATARSGSPCSWRSGRSAR